jgi:hypothetical protein
MEYGLLELIMRIRFRRVLGNNGNLLGIGEIIPPNFCITSVGTDGTKYGYIKGEFGEVDPGMTVDGTPLYEWTYQADGDFIISWGDDGNTHLLDVDWILLKTAKNYTNVADWDDTTTAYIFNDVDAATSLIAEDPSEICMSMTILPENFIHLNYATLFRSA